MARLGMIILAVDDLVRSRAFYGAAFGWPVRLDVPVLTEYELPGGLGLALYVRGGFQRNTGEDASPSPGSGTTSTELYLHCDDLGETMSRLESAGARLLSARRPRDWGDEAAYYADPDGNVIAVAQPIRSARS